MSRTFEPSLAVESTPPSRGRSTFLGPASMWRLNNACKVIFDAFGACPYLVGSALSRSDYRDVDVRLILPDDEFERLYPGATVEPHRDAYWMLVCMSVSQWLSSATGLPVDFQIQAQTDANAKHAGQRNALGVHYEKGHGT